LIVLNSNGLVVLDDDLRGGGIQGDLQIAPEPHRTKEGRGAAHSDAVLRRGLRHAESRKLIAIQVLAERISSFDRRRENVVDDVGLPRESLDGQQAAGRVILAAHPIDLRVVLGAYEVRQNLHRRVRFYLANARISIDLAGYFRELLIIAFIIEPIEEYPVLRKVLRERLVKAALNRN